MSALFAIHTQPNNAVNLEELVHRLIAAKQAEDAAKLARIDLEERILTLVPVREQGSITTAIGGYKLTCTGKLTFKCDMDALRAATADWAPELVPLKTETKLDEAGCKYLRAERPDLWAQLGRVITTSPAKTSITVKV